MIRLKSFEKVFVVTSLLLSSVLTPTLAQTQTQTQIPFANEFWISTRPTGNMYPNGGTLDSPLDGSTAANFDSNMGSLPPHSTIHILAGAYQTYGSRGYFIKSGDKVLGSGMDVTVLQLAPNAPSDDWVLTDDSPAGFTTTNDEVADLTLDCNYQGGSYTYHGLGLCGPGMVVKGVKVIHAAYYDSAVNSESWGITVGGSGELIENCEVSEFDGGVNNAISSITISGGSGIIRNNRVYLPSYTDGSAIAFNGSFNNGVLIEGNYVNGASFGVYNDTGGNTNIIIAHNIFKNVRFGVYYYGNGNIRRNVTMSDNTIMLTTNGPCGSGNSKLAVELGNASTNINIIGNTVGWEGDPQPGDIGSDYFLAVDGIQGVIVADNRADSRLIGIDPIGMPTGANNYIAHDNYDLTGNLLANLGQKLPSGSSVSILPPDAFIQMWGAGSVTVGEILSSNGGGFFGWNCSHNANGAIFKPLPLPNDFWGGKTTFVTSWTIRTTSPGSYVFNVGLSDVLTNDVSGASPYATVTLNAPTGTNITTIAATNSIPSVDPAQIASLQTYIWTGYQNQPANYSILSGKVTAQ